MPGAAISPYNTHSPPARRTFPRFLLIIQLGLISEISFEFFDFRGHYSDNESEVYG
jgi:hypothetical protein